MSNNLPSDEVAEDYKNSLEDLITNDRWQITTLTMIAKENIEHAEAISRILQNHIQRAPPPRKLPALYVLDSIVKNVGTPYTVYFGRNLNNIFMLAYSQVDTAVRRKLEEMLKTWREPVPGSLSTVPVFPITSTQPIVDTLSRFRAAAGATQGRVQPNSNLRNAQAQPFRNTPTPPQNAPVYQTPVIHNATQSVPQNGQHAYPPNSAYSQYPQFQQPQQLPQPLPASLSQYQPPQSLPQRISTPQYQAPSSVNIPPSVGAVDMAKLHDDIDDLTTDAKIECATHPMDQAAQSKLASLQGLKEILDSGGISEQDLIDVRNSILQQKAKKLAPHRPTPPIDMRSSSGPTSSYQNHQPLPNPAPSVTPSFLNQSNLAELLKATANRNQPPAVTYSTSYHPPPIVSTPTISHAVPAPVGELPLLAQLRASGLLSSAPTPSQSLTPTIPSIPRIQTPNTLAGDVQFTSASIKIARPQLITSFLTARPNQCTTCGRRFTSDATGAEKKARHLDWHFKTKARMIEAERRGQNRSWYVDEREWIASREYDDDGGPTDTNGLASEGVVAAGGTGGKKEPTDYVRAPTDPILRSAPCPIDQEHFKSEWSEELQDFIWKDAVLVGGRYYHASCYKEVTREREKDRDVAGGGVTPLGAGGLGRISTPDSVLGKRKAEEEVTGFKSRLKIEVV